jgi:hypothetical protein
MSDGSGDLFDGILRTDITASPTAVTKRSKDLHCFPQNGDGVIFAGGGTLTTEGAFIEINPGDRNSNVNLLRDFRFQEYATVRLLDITIKIGNILAHSGDGYSQIGGNGGFPCATLAAGDRYFQSVVLSTSTQAIPC